MHTLASGPAPLPGFLNSLTGPLDHYGYWAIALLLLLENIGVPVVPGEFAMIGGAIFAGTGRAGLNVVLVGVVSVLVSIAGAQIGYVIGRSAGRELILRYGKYVFIKPHHLDRAEAIVNRFGGFVVIIARYIVGLREANGIIAGITEMHWLAFSVYNVIGACAWVATWVTIGDPLRSPAAGVITSSWPLRVKDAFLRLTVIELTVRPTRSRSNRERSWVALARMVATPVTVSVGGS